MRHIPELIFPHTRHHGITFVFLVLLLAFYGLAGIGKAGAEPAIHSAAEVDYPPFSIVKDGQADGFAVQLMRASLAAMGRDVTFRTGPWNEVRSLLEKGEIDALPLVGRTPEREPLFDFTVPYLTLHGALVVRQDTTNITDLHDLRGRRVAVMKGDNAEEFLRRENHGIEIQTTATFQEAFTDLSQGRCDAVLVQRLVARHLLQSTGLKNLRVINKPVTGFKQQFCFAVKDGDKETLALLNEGLALVIADGTYRDLYTKWFAALVLPNTGHLVIGGDYDYPPYEYLDENGRPAGYNVELTRAIAMEMGLDIEIRLDDWGKIREGLTNGTIDAVQGMFYSEDRDRQFDFSQPHAVINHVAVVRRGTGPPPATFTDLAGKRLVVMQGDIMHDLAVQHGFASLITTVDSHEHALKELAEGKQDYALVAKIPALFLIKKAGLNTLTVGQRPLYSAQYCYAVPNGHLALLAQFTEGLKILKENGEYRRIQEKWLGVYEGSSPGFDEIIHYVVLFAGPLLIIIIVIYIWSWSLRRQVALKTEELRKKEEFQRAMIACSPVALYSIDLDDKVSTWNQSAEQTFGWLADEVIGKPLPTVPDDKKEEFAALRARVLNNQPIVSLEVLRQKKDGTQFDASLSEGPIFDADGRIVGIMGAIEEITARKQAEKDTRLLETRLQQAQKMEAVGTLAGGIAHDFNNILAIILGYGELALEDAPAQSKLTEYITNIHTAAKRARDLVKQILAFSRQSQIERIPLQLQSLIKETLKILRSSIPTTIDIQHDIDSRCGVILADPTQVHQILMNLCTNANHAMEKTGGILKIALHRVVIEKVKTNSVLAIDLPPGEYVELRVTDTGVGIEPDVRKRIFDPYFTTKEQGKGTGMGLAIAHGIITSYGGAITVESTPGKGSTFHVFFPVVTQEKIPLANDSEKMRRGSERILFVDDEEFLAEVGKNLLERLGYQVTICNSSLEALLIFQNNPTEFDLVITDQTMPRMTGADLARRMLQIRPDIPIILLTGYSNLVDEQATLAMGIKAFALKPLTKEILSTLLHKVLDQKAP